MTSERMGRLLLEDAERIGREARGSLEEEAWHRVIRKAQEAAELALKGLLFFLGAEAPKVHDFSRALRRVLLDRGFASGATEELAGIVRELAVSRAPAFYGDEAREVPPQDLFDRNQAEQAIRSMERAIAFARESITGAPPAGDGAAPEHQGGA